VLGVPISRRAIQRAVDRVSEAIQPHDEAIAEQARAAMVNDIDETAWYQHGVLAWLWVLVNTAVALFTVYASRSKAAFEVLVERWVERILSVRETCRLRGVPTFPILGEAITCYFNGLQPDVSWIERLCPPEQLPIYYLSTHR
jgi:hypothetical protein